MRDGLIISDALNENRRNATQELSVLDRAEQKAQLA